jgi:hypothetical protein
METDMKLKLALMLCLASCSAPLLASQADAVKATAAQRCVMLADYAQDVAEMRDLGMPLKEIKEHNAERYANNILDAYNIAAGMAYKHSELAPAQVREGLLTGCMHTVNAEAERRQM